MGGAGWGPISRGNLPFWCSSLVHPVPYALLHLASKGVRRIRNAARVPPHTILVVVLVLVLVLVRVPVPCLGPFRGPGC